MLLQAHPENNFSIHIGFREPWIKLSSISRDEFTSYLGTSQGASWLRLHWSDSSPYLAPLVSVGSWKTGTKAEQTWWLEASLGFVSAHSPLLLVHSEECFGFTIYPPPWRKKNWIGVGSVYNQVSSQHGYRLKSKEHIRHWIPNQIDSYIRKSSVDQSCN